MNNNNKQQITNNAKQFKNKETCLISAIACELIKQGINSFVLNDNTIYTIPNIVFKARRIVVFCKISIDANKLLKKDGWTVIQFSKNEIDNSLELCANRIRFHLHSPLPEKFRAIDLCSGIGGIRKGFELTGKFQTVLSSEIDKHACMTYEHLFGVKPFGDLTTEEFKKTIETINYDILLAGFPCQTFSRVGLGEGFENEEKGKIFFHIASIIKETRPCAIFLENVENLVTRDKGKTFATILNILVIELNYHIIGVTINDDGRLIYNPKDFVRNSRCFGIPQNRPRTYIVGFDKERFSKSRIKLLPISLPEKSETLIYRNLNDLLEVNVDEKYYMSSGYFETLVRHRARQEGKGYGFGYRIVNEQGIENPIANSLLATGGSGKERNLVFDPRDGIAGKEIPGKQTPLNAQGIRVMTPTEWGKLQGFINYAFVDAEGQDRFSFPDKIPNAQKYKQFGNSVTIPVIEEMAKFILKCFDLLK